MKSFGAYISKYFISFIALMFLIIMMNVIAFGITFYGSMSGDYGETAPRNMLEETLAASDAAGISEVMAEKLKSSHIWGMFLTPDGKSAWSVNRPKEVPDTYTLQDVAAFTKGYLSDYPVFVQGSEKGLLVLGYPKGSYTKLTSNFFPIKTIRRMPVFIMLMLAVDILLLFLAYLFSKKRIVGNTEPIIAAIRNLSDGKLVSISINGELSEVAQSINRVSHILSRQNQARANWISGVSHDIRTPLSMIMGYAQRIADDSAASTHIREEAAIIGRQSCRMKELVRDLNLVSQLEYEMQPLNKKSVRLSSLLRTYVAKLLNEGVSDRYSFHVNISPVAENAFLSCDERLIARAVSNLVHNSIQHNPKGCEITVSLNCSEHAISLTVADNGVGLSDDKLRELQEVPHYMESTDERLDLRHGLGLILVHQIAAAHKGTVTIESEPNKGYQAAIDFPKHEEE